MLTKNQNNNLKAIQAPLLNQIKFGKNLVDVFENIDYNFKILSNNDFVKGARGYSVKSGDIKLITERNNEKYFTTEGVKIIQAVVKEFLSEDITFTQAEPSVSEVNEKLNTIKGAKSVTYKNNKGENAVANVIDLITVNDTIKTISTYDPSDINGATVPVSSLNSFILRDGRFCSPAVSLLGEDSIEVFSDLVDLSCSVYMTYDENNQTKYTILNNIPKLYYDKNQGYFCWEIGTIRTGMIAQGPSGKSGKSMSVKILKSKETYRADSEDSSYYANEYISSNGWADISASDKDELPIGTGCIVFLKDSEKSIKAFLSTIIAHHDNQEKPGYFTAEVFCDENNLFPNQFNANELEEIMTHQIDSSSSTSTLKGLHVPYSTEDRANGARHMIWSFSEGGADYNALHISPLASYSEFRDKGNLNYSTGGKLYLDYSEIVMRDRLLVNNNGENIYTIIPEVGEDLMKKLFIRSYERDVHFDGKHITLGGVGDPKSKGEYQYNGVITLHNPLGQSCINSKEIYIGKTTEDSTERIDIKANKINNTSKIINNTSETINNTSKIINNTVSDHFSINDLAKMKHIWFWYNGKNNDKNNVSSWANEDGWIINTRVTINTDNGATTGDLNDGDGDCNLSIGSKELKLAGVKLELNAKYNTINILSDKTITNKPIYYNDIPYPIPVFMARVTTQNDKSGTVHGFTNGQVYSYYSTGENAKTSRLKISYDILSTSKTAVTYVPYNDNEGWAIVLRIPIKEEYNRCIEGFDPEERYNSKDTNPPIYSFWKSNLYDIFHFEAFTLNGADYIIDQGGMTHSHVDTYISEVYYYKQNYNGKETGFLAVKVQASDDNSGNKAMWGINIYFVPPVSSNQSSNT